jgi:hypothetical protein
MKYVVEISAPDGKHRHTSATVAGALAEAERQLGRSLVDQLDFEQNDGTGAYQAPDVGAVLEAGGCFRVVCDYGRVIVVKGVA